MDDLSIPKIYGRFLIIFVVCTVILYIFGIFFIESAATNSHGAGEMDAYITKVSRIGDRVFVTAKDSAKSSNTYDGCASSSDEQKFKDAIGKKVKLTWDGAFSLAPFWTECPGPIQIEEEE